MRDGEAPREHLTAAIGTALAIGLLLAVPPAGFAYGPDMHVAITNSAVQALVDVDEAAAVDVMAESTGRCDELPPTPTRYGALWFRELPYTRQLWDLVCQLPGGAGWRAMQSRYDSLPPLTKLGLETEYVDLYRDLEFVDVDFSRDDPHVDAWDEDDDNPHTMEEGRALSTFCHFIDIRKGPVGLFDDYDGYAYHKGSGCREEYQDAADATDDLVKKALSWGAGFKVDEGVMWWFNDEYVHAPGHNWYRAGKLCSPALERYCFPQDKGVYNSVEEECRHRFARAQSTGQPGMGIPYSVFPPVDNVARYWFDQFESERDPVALGPVLHAIQDASVPHHAAGCLGNWHDRYEKTLDQMTSIVLQPSFEADVKALLAQWTGPRSAFGTPASSLPAFPLTQDKWDLVPHISWPVDQLVTWVALNAYHEYDATYRHYRQGYSFNAGSAQRLMTLATAMSALVLKKAARPQSTRIRVRLDPTRLRRVLTPVSPKHPGRPGRREERIPSTPPGPPVPPRP